MDLVRGGELRRHLKLVKRLEENLARFYVIQIAYAIAELHSKDVAHRDLKPENILVSEDGYLCVTDFGLSKIITGCEQAHSLCGTLEYMAPEILRDEGHSKSVDWWSLGIITYEMLVG